MIKYSTITLQLPTGQTGTGLLHDESGNEITYWFTLTKQGTFGTIDYFSASQPMEAYLDAATNAEVIFLRSSTVGTGQAYATISGYLVDVP